MIIAGVLIGLFGLFLCFTIILIPVGIILMFVGGGLMTVGLIRGRKTVITNVVQVSSVPGHAMQANIPVDTSADQITASRRIEPPAYNPQQRDFAPSPRMIDVTPNASYDQTKWAALVRYDDDIARVAKALEAYDKKYTDEFAAAYLVLNDKAYLPMIIKKILASAKQDAARRPA